MNYWEKLSDLSKATIPPHPNEIDTAQIIEKNENGFYHLCHSENFNVFAGEIKHTVPCLGYIICEDNLPGKLDVGILKSKGVPPGPLYGKIKNGEAVTLENGTIVTPEECVGPERPGRKVVILGDTYDPSNVASLAADATILIHESTNENGDQEKSVAHGHSTAGIVIELTCWLFFVCFLSFFVTFIDNRLVFSI